MLLAVKRFSALAIGLLSFTGLCRASSQVSAQTTASNLTQDIADKPSKLTHRAKSRSRLFLSGKASQEHSPGLTLPWIMVTHTHLLGIPAAASPLAAFSKSVHSLLPAPRH